MGKFIQEKILHKRLEEMPLKMIKYAGKINGKSTFKCNKCHLEWLAAFSKVQKGYGCPRCNKLTCKSKSEYNTYLEGRDINMVYYSGNTTVDKSEFNCKICSHTWWTLLKRVVSPSKNSGCPKCANKIPLTLDDCSKRLADRQLKVIVYAGRTRLKSTFSCNKCHYIWTSTYSNVITGRNCPKCSKTGFNITKPAWLYVLRLTTPQGDCYGFGVTNDLKTRIRVHKKSLGSMLEEVYESWYFDNGVEAKELESMWKKSPHIVNINVPSFKTECVLINNETTKMIFGY